MIADHVTAKFVVSCEPALSGYRFGVDLFRAFTLITSATLIPLTNASLLAKVIVGSAVEHMDIDRIVSELGPAIGQLIHSGQQSVDDVANELYQKLTREYHCAAVHRSWTLTALRSAQRAYEATQG